MCFILGEWDRGCTFLSVFVRYHSDSEEKEENDILYFKKK